MVFRDSGTRRSKDVLLTCPSDFPGMVIPQISRQKIMYLRKNPPYETLIKQENSLSSRQESCSRFDLPELPAPLDSIPQNALIHVFDLPATG